MLLFCSHLILALFFTSLGHLVSLSQSICTFESPSKFCAPLQKRALFPDATDCHKFYECFQGNPAGFTCKCDPGLYFDVVSRRCLAEGTTSCTADASIVVSGCCPSSCYPGVGCRQFFACSSQFKYGYCCDSGKRFNAAKCACEDDASCTDACTVLAPQNITNCHHQHHDHNHHNVMENHEHHHHPSNKTLKVSPIVMTVYTNDTTDYYGGDDDSECCDKSKEVTKPPIVTTPQIFIQNPLSKFYNNMLLNFNSTFGKDVASSNDSKKLPDMPSVLTFDKLFPQPTNPAATDSAPINNVKSPTDKGGAQATNGGAEENNWSGNYFFLIEKEIPFRAADGACRRAFGEFAYIKTDEEMDMVRALLDNHDNMHWVNLESDGGWKWLDGTRVSAEFALDNAYNPFNEECCLADVAGSRNNSITLVAKNCDERNEALCIVRQNGNINYRWLRGRLTWYKARTECERYHGELVSLHTIQDKKVALRIILDESAGEAGIWVGCQKKSTHIFRWSDGREMPTDSPWWRTDTSPTDIDGYYCGAFVDDGLFRADCDGANPVICRKTHWFAYYAAAAKSATS